MIRIPNRFLVAIGFSALTMAMPLSLSAADAQPEAAREQQDQEARLQSLLTALEEQSNRLEEQAAALEAERAELARQRAELLTLGRELQAQQAAQAAEAQTATVTAASPAPAMASATRSAKADFPQRAAPSPGRQATARSDLGALPPQRTHIAQVVQVDQRTQKNQTADSTPGLMLASSDTPTKRRTLMDLVREANAPRIAAQTEVGQRPEEEESEIDIAVLADRGGVLTPKGTVVFDPSVSYTHSSVNRFFFDGVELVEAILIGEFEAQDIDRDSVTTSLGMRYGLTRRLEADARISWLYRDDRTFNKALSPDNDDVLRELSGSGLGDVDLGLHYQINKPKGNFPYFVANLRASSDTGTGPFDVDRNLETGLETELPTGSGFWTLEPSLTMIYPSDPAVLFANIGYQWGIKKGVDATILDRTFTDVEAPGGPETTRSVSFVEEVDPGDAISLSLGMGIGLNDAVSLSFGYEHTWVFATETTQMDTTYVNGVSNGGVRSTFDGDDAQIAALAMGASVNVSEGVGISFNVAAGLTDDSPDVTVSMRTPLSRELFK